MTAPPPQFVVIDTETTGLDPERDRIIDIGAVRLGPDLEPTDSFTTLIAPGAPIPLFVTRLTGIDDGEAASGLSFAEAFEELRSFAGDALLVGHNAGFDREHLAAGARRAGLAPLANHWFDTLEAALLLYPELDRHALPLLAQAFGLETRAHRALPDAETTAVVLKRLAARAAGLAADERRLLEAVAWPPLRVLDACAVPADEAPPAPAPDEGRRGGPLPALPVDAGAWRPELEGDEEPADDAKAGDAERPDDAKAGDAGAPDGAAATSGGNGATDHERGGRTRLAQRLPGFRRRPGQVELADAAAEVFADGGVGLFEAGTGMGKSLAYLLPAAFAAAADGRRIVVSTKTKALQRQLAAHELPLVADALPPEWRWTLLMGRENYLCRRRLHEALETESASLPDTGRALALAYLVGRARRGEVDLSALPYRATRILDSLTELARELRSSRATCLGRFCPARATCHWRLARSRAEASHLVCVNHALLLTGREALPAFEDVVIDEAHLLYQEATEAFSEQVDAQTLSLLLSDLRGRRRQRPLPQRLRAAARGLAPDQARPVVEAADACERAATTLPDLSLSMSACLLAVADAAARDQETGAPGGGGADYNTTVWLTPGLRELPEYDRFVTGAGLLAEGLQMLATAAGAGAEALPDDHREHAALTALAEDGSTYAHLLGELPDGGGPNAVVWAEIEAASRTGGAAPRWTLSRTPITPAPHVREALWDRLRSAVLTSATLTVAGSFAYFRDMTGLDADVDVREQVFPSPFDFRRQAVLVLEHDPGGSWHPNQLADRQAERLKKLAEVTGGRTLALFTNKRDMHRVAAAVGEHIEEDGVLVLAQGLHGSAASLADEFRAHPETILLGVDTLWTGQDFPGDALTCLVIAKLPFPRQDPLFRARKRACEESGVRWFDQFYLPEAILKFRQGFGRLIRTESDAGVVVVLDHRLTQKGYRRDFLASLPDMEVVEAAPADIAAVVEYYLRSLMADREAFAEAPLT